MATDATTTTATPTTTSAPTPAPTPEPAAAKVPCAEILALHNYVGETNYENVNKSKATNKGVIKVIIATIKKRLEMRYTQRPEIKLDVGAQTQLLILMRMLYRVAIKNKFDESTDLATGTNLPPGSFERNVIVWLAGIVTGTGRQWTSLWDSISSEMPDELSAISAEYKEEPDTEAFCQFGEVAMVIIAREIAELATDFLGPRIDVDEVKSVTLDASNLNGYLRKMNAHGQVGMDLFVTLGKAANGYSAAKDYWNAKTKDQRDATKAAEKAKRDKEKADKDAAKAAAKATKATSGSKRR